MPFILHCLNFLFLLCIWTFIQNYRWVGVNFTAVIFVVIMLLFLFCVFLTQILIETQPVQWWKGIGSFPLVSFQLEGDPGDQVFLIANFAVLYNMKCWDRFENAPSQWETTSHCNGISHWLGAFPKRYLKCALHGIDMWYDILIVPNTPAPTPTKTKWTLFLRQNFQVHFLEWKLLNFK